MNLPSGLQPISFFATGTGVLLFIKGPDDLSTTKERLLGFQSAMKQYGVPIDPDLILNGDFGFRSGYTAVMMLHRRRIPFTAIVASNDMMALGAIQALRELNIFGTGGGGGHRLR